MAIGIDQHGKAFEPDATRNRHAAGAVTAVPRGVR